MGTIAEQLLPTEVVGSYPQPEWLIDRAALASQVPRVRARELWLIDPERLDQAQDDATELAVRAMERAGVDVVTDGEIRRESYSNHFATALEGLDVDEPGRTLGRSGQEVAVPRVVGPIRRVRPVEDRDVAFLRRITDRRIKATVPGPFTMSQQAQDEHYGDSRSLALAFADAVNEELRDLAAAGADIVQLDEPWLQARPEQAREFGVEAIDRALDGVAAQTALHICHGYAAVVHEKSDRYAFLGELDASSVGQVSIEAAQPNLDLSVLRALPSKRIAVGVLDLHDPEVEPVSVIVARIHAALEHVEPSRLVVAPDCGMKYLPRDTAFGKLRAMVQAAQLVRAELR
ncbi:MAG TPA: uroporphyrinogen decarboxylase family protein [Solirubrobacteraceae bacterium]|jgi:5-methyltetrahydropteroyltriglutamate--homocysteine methyltransferase